MEKISLVRNPGMELQELHRSTGATLTFCHMGGGRKQEKGNPVTDNLWNRGALPLVQIPFRHLVNFKGSGDKPIPLITFFCAPLNAIGLHSYTNTEYFQQKKQS